MHAVSYLSPKTRTARLGFMHDGRINGSPREGSLQAAIEAAASLHELGLAAIERPLEIVSVEEVDLLPSIARPPSFRDFISFEQHIVRSLGGRPVPGVWHEQPVFYFSNPANFIGPRDDVQRFPGCEWFDFELEIAAVIGRDLSDASPAESEAAIVGYALLCDWSARDHQQREAALGLGPVKAKDGATTLGAILVTPDELEPRRTERGYDLELSIAVNGKRFGGGNWSDIHWSFPEMISFASRGTRVLAGDVFGSGTVPSGCIVETLPLDPHPWLSPGDLVEIDAGPMGTMRSTVREGTQPKRTAVRFGC